MEEMLSKLEVATVYSVDHPIEDGTRKDLINCSTEIQDEHDNKMDDLRQMLRRIQRRQLHSRRIPMANYFRSLTQLVLLTSSTP